MVRELYRLYEEAQRKTTECSDPTQNDFLEVYARFCDMREERMVNFALRRWAVPYVGEHIEQIKINFLAGVNEVYFPEGIASQNQQEVEGELKN